MKDQKEYYSSIGEFVMKFGDLETFIFRAPHIILFYYFKDNPELNKIRKLLKNDIERLNVKIQYLKNFVDIYVHEDNKANWFELITEVESLSQFRNTILHHSWYYDFENDTYLKAKNLDFSKENLIEVNDIETRNIKMDFLITQISELWEFYFFTITGDKDVLEMYNIEKILRVK